MVTTNTRARHHFTAAEYARMAALGIPAHAAYRFTTDEYDRMIAAGIIREGTRVELIEGEIVEMAAQGHHHVWCVAQLSVFVGDNRPPGTFMLVQCAIRLTDNSEPEPDIVLTHLWDRARTNPTPADILLLMEVADRTIDEDRDEKLPRYARAGIVEAWLVDIRGGVIERHTEPRDGQYRQKVVARPGETLASTTVPEIVIPVADVFR